MYSARSLQGFSETNRNRAPSLALRAVCVDTRDDRDDARVVRASPVA